MFFPNFQTITFVGENVDYAAMAVLNRDMPKFARAFEKSKNFWNLIPIESVFPSVSEAIRMSYHFDSKWYE